MQLWHQWHCIEIIHFNCLVTSVLQITTPLAFWRFYDITLSPPPPGHFPLDISPSWTFPSGHLSPQTCPCKSPCHEKYGGGCLDVRGRFQGKMSLRQRSAQQTRKCQFMSGHKHRVEKCSIGSKQFNRNERSSFPGVLWSHPPLTPFPGHHGEQFTPHRHF